MIENIRPITKLVSVTVDNRTIEADVEYILRTYNEVHPIGSTVAYEQRTDFTVQQVSYLTPEMTVEEKKILDALINQGPYE